MTDGQTTSADGRLPGQRTLSHLVRTLPLFWRLHLGGWLLFGISTIPMRMYLVSNVYVDMTFRTALTYYLLRDTAAMIFSVGLRYLYRVPVFHQLRPVPLSAVLVLICSLWALVEMLLCQPLVDSLVSPVSISSISGLWAATYWFRSWQYLLWSFCYFAIKNFMDARRQERLRLEAETRQKEAELLMLRSQMDPHFLFNALNAIRSTAQMDPIQIKLVEGLSEYLRYSLHYRGSSLVPLGEEINAMRRYLDVEETRYGPGIEVRMDIDPASREVLVPGIFVQPLVENAIKYGRRTSPHPLHLLVSTRLIGEDTLQLTVANSGSWIEPDDHELCQPRSSGAGLDILRRRLQLTYGSQAGISVGPQGDRVVAEIEIQHIKRHRPGSAPLPLHNIEVPI